MSCRGNPLWLPLSVFLKYLKIYGSVLNKSLIIKMNKKKVYKTIVCLAYSRKFGGRCVAGKEIVNNEITPNWIRPVSDIDTGELYKNHIRLYNIKWPKWISVIIVWFMQSKPQPNVLDVIKIPLLEPKPGVYQSENHLINPREPWIKQGSLSASQLPELCDSVPSLWFNGYHSFKGVNDRMPVEITNQSVHHSLLLIKPDRLSISVDKTFSQVKIRSDFDFNRERYQLVVTDPNIEYLYHFKPEGEYEIGSEVYLCISLGEPFEGYCYKLVAAIIPA